MNKDRIAELGRLLIGVAGLALAGCIGPIATSPSESAPAPESMSAEAFASRCEAWDDWDKPAPPFRLHGGTYYVGTCGITSILITGREGHLVIDSGTERGGELVVANIEKLGFSLDDVRFLTHTQEHFDHVGGMAHLKAQTGARMIASDRARSVFESGIVDTDDPQYSMIDPMPRVSVDALIADGDAIVLGEKRVVATYTPGHSPGAISWRWEECEGDRCHTFVFTDGMGPFASDDYRWSDDPDYLADYRNSLHWLKTVEADICLSAHPSQVGLIERLETGRLVDRDRCNIAGASIHERLDLILEDQKMP